MPRISDAERADRQLKRARKAHKEKGVYLRSIKDGIGTYDITVDDGVSKKTKRIQLPIAASNVEFANAVKAVQDELKTVVTEATRLPFTELIEKYVEGKQLRASTADKLRLYLRGYGYNDRENKRLVDELISGELSQGTKRMRFKAVRAVFSYLREALNVDVKDPTQGTAVPREGSPRSRIPSDAEISELLVSLEKTGRHKDVLFCRLIIHTGARCSTIEKLRPCDMDSQWRLALYNVKMDRRYAVKLPINDTVIQALWEMCTCGLSPDAPIFDKEARNRLRERMRRLFGKDANGETLSPHSFRHLRCTQLARDGVHVSMAAKLLDASPQVLLRTYTTITQEDVDAMYSTPKSTPDSVSDVQTCNHTPEEKTASERKFRAPRRM
jgi:integrase